MSNSYLHKIVYLTEDQAEELFNNGSITVGTTTVTYNADDLYITPDDINVNLIALQNNLTAQINDLSASLNEASAQIQANTNALEQKVSQEDYDYDQSALNLRVSTAEQQQAILNDTVDTLQDQTSSLTDWQKKWFNAQGDDSELALSKQEYDETAQKWIEGDYKAIISDDKISFLEKKQEIAYINNSTLVATQGGIKNKFMLGGLTATVDGYDVTWTFDSDSLFVKRNYFAGTATPNSLSMAASSNYKYGDWVYLVSDGQTLISGNQDDTFTISYDYKLSNVVSNAPDFRIGLLFYSNEVQSDTWPARLSGGNNYDIIKTNGASEYSGHFETTFKLTDKQASGTITRMRGYLRSVDGTTGWTGITLTISHLKLEKNDKATPWVKALEDA